MQSKTVKELHHNMRNFSKCDADLKYMTLTDLLSLLKKNELEPSILGIDTQRLVLGNIYQCICGDKGDLQDLSMQCLPYITIQFNSEEMISLSLKLCKHLQSDLPSRQDDEEKYNSILRESVVITNSIKCMCCANRVLFNMSHQRISAPPLLTDSPLLLPQTAFTNTAATSDDQKTQNKSNDDGSNPTSIANHENISRLIESLSSLLLNIIASKQQSMMIEFTKHNDNPREWLASICFEHYHEQILFALDVLFTIIDNHGKAVSFIFESASSVLLNLLSGAHHDYTNSNNKITENTKVLESKKVNKKAIECLGSLSRFLPDKELKHIINTLCDTITKCIEQREYTTLKNLFDAINKISNDCNKKLSFASQCELCNKTLSVISSDAMKEEIEVREYGLMALETLIANSSSSNIISLFPEILAVLSLGLKYDPNVHNVSNDVQENDGDEEKETTGWTDEDEDDSWGSDDGDDNDEDDSWGSDDGDDNDEDMKIPVDEDAQYFEKLDQLNQNLDDDDDDSWKVRRASNKCLLAMIRTLADTERDINPNMWRLVKQNVMNDLLLLLNARCCERVKRIKINIFETYNTLLLHLENIFHNPEIYITLSADVIHTICSQIADKDYQNEVLLDVRYNDPDVYQPFFDILTNVARLCQQYYTNEHPQFIPCIIPLSISTIGQYTNEKWNKAIASVFRYLSAIYSNHEYVQAIGNKNWINQIFGLNMNITTHCTSNDVLESMFECMGIIAKYVEEDKQHVLLNECVDRLQKWGQQQNVMNATALCLNVLLSLKQNKHNKDTLQMGMKLADELMANEATRLSGIKLSISCIKSLPQDVSMDELCQQTVIKSIVGKLSSFLKQNALDVRFLSLNGLALSYDKYPSLCSEFALSLSDTITVLKNIFDHNSHSLNESCDRLKAFVSALIHLFDEHSTVFEDKYDVKRLFNVFVIPLLEAVTHSNAIHPSLFPLWTNLWRLIGFKLIKMVNDDDDAPLLSFMNGLHDKLVGSNLILSTKAAKFQSCSCCASLFNPFLDNPLLQSFFTQFMEEETKDDDEDEDMEPVYNNNTAVISRQMNQILMTQLLLMNEDKRSMVLDKYRQYVSNTYKELSSVYISSCYLSRFITDCDAFMNTMNELSGLQAQFALNSLSKVVEGMDMMARNDAEQSLLSGNDLQRLIQFTQQFCDAYFNESATVISHLLCNNTAQNQTFAVIDRWLGAQSRCRLGMEALTSALITMNGISNELLFSKFCHLIRPPFVHKVVSFINDKDLSVSLSALKNVKFLILTRIPAAVQSEDEISKLLFILLDRTRSSSDYIEKISFGPITKLVDQSASVRSLAFEVITDIIEYNNKCISNEFIEVAIERFIEAMSCDDTQLTNYAIQSFQILIRSGVILAQHITKPLIECIAKEIENCKGGETTNASGNKMDSNQKEKLGHLLRFYAVIRKSVSNVLSLDYVTSHWNSISSLMTQIKHNPSFLTRTPSMVYNENMEIGQPLLLSPSLRSGSVSALQRDNSLQYLEPLDFPNKLNHTNTNTSNDIIDID
eukprot:990129_1